MASSHKPAWTVAAILLGFLVLGGGVLLYWPTVLSGPAYDLRVNSVTVRDGKMRVEFEDRLAYGTRYDWNFPGTVEFALVNVDQYSLRDQGFLRWPRTARDQLLQFDLNPKGRDLEGGSDPAALRARVLLQPGTYKLHPDERLIIFRAKTRTGEVLEGYIKAGIDR
jgi:hypothetical protein